MLTGDGPGKADIVMSDQEPEVIIPRFKLIVTYDVPSGGHDHYYQFIMSEFIPAMQEMGVYMAEAWHTAYGDYPLRMASFVAEDYETIQNMLSSKRWRELEGRFLTYVRNYSHKVVEYRPGFQFVR